MRELVPGLAVPLNEASRKALRPLVAATKANAPVDSGDLKRTIGIRRVRSPKIRPVHVVAPSVRYAHIPEFGRAPNADGNGEIIGQRFMTRAFEATSAAVLKALELEIPEAIRRRVAKIAAKAKR